jgi:ribosomal protein S27AE
MTSETHRKWLDAAIKLGAVATSEVACPACNQASLLTQDITWDGVLSERRIFCPNCGAQNYLLYSRNRESENIDEKNEM